jgi:hypothetical protein
VFSSRSERHVFASKRSAPGIESQGTRRLKECARRNGSRRLVVDVAKQECNTRRAHEVLRTLVVTQAMLHKTV